MYIYVYIYIHIYIYMNMYKMFEPVRTYPFDRQFQVWAKMDRRINLWSTWAVSAPSLELPSFGPAILDGQGWMIYGRLE